MTRFLVDTNILIYWLTDMLDEDTKALVGDYGSMVYVSSVSVMEFIHLIQNGRIKIHKHPNFDVFRFIEEELEFRILSTSREHLKQLERLPVVDGHNDPNDRLIIAQAINERLELVSSDAKFRHYVKFGLDFVQAKKVE